MFRNRDRGLSNTLYWFFEVWNSVYSGALPHYSEGKSKKYCKHFEQCFSLHTNGEQTCLGLPELLLVSETSTMCLTISVRIGTVVRYSFFCKRQMRECSVGMATTVGKFIPQIQFRRDVTFS